MQLHTLAHRGGILPLGHGAGHHGIGLQHHVVFKPVLHQLTLDPQNAANGYVIDDGLCFLGFQEPADANGIGVVGHIELDHPGVALGQLLVLHRKHPALHDDGAHIQVQVLHGGWVSPEGLAVKGLRIRGLLFLLGDKTGLGGRGLLELLPADFFHGIHQCLTGQLSARLHLNGHRHRKPGLQRFLHGGNQLFDGIPAVGRQADGELCSLPAPFCPGKGAPGHGVPFHKQEHQLLGLDFCQLRFRMGDGNLQPSQTVKALNIPGRLIGKTPGDVGFAVGCHFHAFGCRVNVGSNNGRPGEDRPNLLRRHIVRKHIQDGYILIHTSIFSILRSSSGSSWS